MKAILEMPTSSVLAMSDALIDCCYGVERGVPNTIDMMRQASVD